MRLASKVLNLHQNVLKLFHTQTPSSFGFVVDIDGVIFRGKDVLPGVHEAIKLLTDENKKFRFPFVSFYLLEGNT